MIMAPPRSWGCRRRIIGVGRSESCVQLVCTLRQAPRSRLPPTRASRSPDRSACDSIPDSCSSARPGFPASAGSRTCPRLSSRGVSSSSAFQAVGSDVVEVVIGTTMSYASRAASEWAPTTECPCLLIRNRVQEGEGESGDRPDHFELHARNGALMRSRAGRRMLRRRVSTSLPSGALWFVALRRRRRHSRLPFRSMSRSR